MSAYTTEQLIERVIPANFLAEALDDTTDAGANVVAIADLIAQIGDEIDGLISPGVTLPLSSTPPLIQTAATTLVCEMLYLRRGLHGDANPWTERAKTMRETLAEIGAGKRKLLADAPAAARPSAGFADHARPLKFG